MLRTLTASTLLLSNLTLAAPAPLSAGSTDIEIARHMLAHEAAQTMTDELAAVFPDLGRDRAYRIQQVRMALQADEHPQVGWKLGWPRMDGDEPLDPVVGHYLTNRVFPEGEPISVRHFTEGTARAEPEIVIVLKKDLRGPVVTRSQVEAAIESVSVGLEFVNWRVAEPRGRTHAVADNAIAAGAMLTKGRRFALDEVDFSTEFGSVSVNGGPANTGPATTIFGEDPVSAVHWAANELIRYGMHMKAGDFIFTGSVCTPLPVVAGDTATVSFTNLGTITATFVE